MSKPNDAPAAETTRTTEPEGADATEQVEEREPGEAGRDAEPKDTTDYRSLWLEVGKPAAERLNGIEQRLSETERRVGASTPAPAATRESDDDFDVSELAAAEQFAAEDPVARLTVKLAKALKKERAKSEGLVGALSLNEQLRDIDDKDKRTRVREHFRTNQHRLVDIASAEAEVDRDTLREQNEKLKAELAKSIRRADPNVVRTTERDVPATEAKTRTVSRADWERQQAALEWTDPAQFRANQRKARNNEIRIKD